MTENHPNGQKTLWEKEKLLVTSYFSFSHSVFKRLVLQTHKNKGLFAQIVRFDFYRITNIGENGALVFTCLQYKSLENTVGKGEIACNEQFLLFPQCFLPIWKSFCHFHETQNCRLQTFSI